MAVHPNGITVGLVEAAEKDPTKPQPHKPAVKEEGPVGVEVNGKSNGFSSNVVARTATMRKLHLTWVTTRMNIEIYRYPSWGDVVEIETWPQRDGRIGIKRDWIIKDFANGEFLGRATRCYHKYYLDSRNSGIFEHEKFNATLESWIDNQQVGDDERRY
ncbi:oleoyl-acyl carrier protein thioesterase, chloroplastic-like protein [Tanacetum coccineum]